MQGNGAGVENGDGTLSMGSWPLPPPSPPMPVPPPPPLLFLHQPHIVAYLQATFTFVKSSHWRIELHLRMMLLLLLLLMLLLTTIQLLMLNLRRWCRSSDDLR